MNKIRVPQSRFRRELNKWLRYLENNPLDTIYVTRNKKDIGVMISPEQFHTLTTGEINDKN